MAGFPSASEWATVLNEFRALGGIAENVEIGSHSVGRGLFPGDPAQPYLLRVPNELLFRVSDVEFIHNRIRIKPDAKVGHAERDFFERYQELLSWGLHGRTETEDLVSIGDRLPAELRAKLATGFEMELFRGEDFSERTRKQFIRSRTLDRNMEKVFAPVVELANRSANGVRFLWDAQGNLELDGKTKAEILLDYGSLDSLGVFRKFAIPVVLPQAFSMPIKTAVGSRNLTILRNTAEKVKRGSINMPELTEESGELFLSHLMVGNSKFPRAPRGIFCTLMREAGVGGAEEAFDVVLRFNRLKFLELLGALEPLRGEMVTRLRAMVSFQLEAMTHCVGTREF